MTVLRRGASVTEITRNIAVIAEQTDANKLPAPAMMFATYGLWPLTSDKLAGIHSRGRTPGDRTRSGVTSQIEVPSGTLSNADRAMTSSD